MLYSANPLLASMNELCTIFDALAREGLRPPISSATSSPEASLTSSPSLNHRYAQQQQQRPNASNVQSSTTSHSNSLVNRAQLSSHNTTVDDSDDPRWRSFMNQYFVDDDNANHDDMLFFVRHPPYRKNSDTLNIPEANIQRVDEKSATKSDFDNEGKDDDVAATKDKDAVDAVFVLRKQPAPNKLPPLPCPVMWKDTFFLNLIVQMPCKLTVAVCRRRNRNGTTVSVARKQISKRVYALPNRSRVDGPKDNIGPPECSWPMIYYFIDDYEDMFEDVVIKKGDYLCVELSTRMPSSIAGSMSPSSMMSPPVSTRLADRLDLLDEKRGLWCDRPSAPPSNGAAAAAAGRIPSSNNTNSGMLNSAKSRLGSSGSTSNGTSKVILFQGATSYTALLETYFQRVKSKNVLHRLRKPAYPTEYVMMRAPVGNGYSQVAITGVQVPEGSTRPSSTANGSSSSRRTSDPANAGGLANHPSLATMVDRPSSAMPNRTMSPPPLPDTDEKPSDDNNTDNNDGSSPRLNQATSTPALSSWFKKLSLQSIAGNISQATSPPPPPKAIRCCMTFVTIPWTSIIHELYAFKDIQTSNSAN